MEVPDTPPGRYLLLIYDGGESGNHYTWDYVTVRGQDDRSAGGDDAGVNVAIIAAIGLVAGAASVVGGIIMWRKVWGADDSGWGEE